MREYNKSVLLKALEELYVENLIKLSKMVSKSRVSDGSARKAIYPIMRKRYNNMQNVIKSL